MIKNYVKENPQIAYWVKEGAKYKDVCNFVKPISYYTYLSVRKFLGLQKWKGITDNVKLKRYPKMVEAIKDGKKYDDIIDYAECCRNTYWQLKCIIDRRNRLQNSKKRIWK